MMNSRLAVQRYQNVGTHSAVEEASPHRLIQMLMGGMLDRVAHAKGCIEQRDIAGQGKNISVAISIVGGLRASLDKEMGGEIAANLDNLYDYMERRLLEANIQKSVPILDEVAGLMREIKEAWDAIGDQV